MLFYLIFSIALLLLLYFSPELTRPKTHLPYLKAQISEISANWLAAVMALVIPAIPMGSAGLAILAVVIRFVQPLDSARLPDYGEITINLYDLLRKGYINWQPVGFLGLFLGALVIIGLWLVFSQIQVAILKRRKESKRL